MGISERLGLECYMGLGMTEACSRIWLYDGLFDAKNCALTCAKSWADPYNIPPTCELNDCLQCDEDMAGPIFKQFGGRTRRNSGLESAIQRPCESVATIEHA